jgi:serine/threonine-protein kinase
MIDSGGTLIAGRYEVLRPLGRGGIGKVFLVLDRQTGTEVALKMLRTKYQRNERALKRFEREVSATRKLDHPCIVKILDVHQDAELTFYTMEYVDGKTLRKWMKQRGQLDFGSVVRVLSLIAHGLEHAHAYTIHRDISPENVMVMRDGSIRILDFGLAKLEDLHTNLTMVGVSLGKIAYMSPEQRVSATEVDHRADLYPLGVMFYEMLTGDLPRYNETLSDVCPDLPADCQRFLDKAMAEDPDARFQTAQEFRHALRDLYESFKSDSAATINQAPAAARVRPKARAAAAASPPSLLARLRARVKAWFRKR